MCIRDSLQIEQFGPAALLEIGTGLRRERSPEIGLYGRQIACLLYTSDAADERSSVDLGGRRIIKKKKNT